MMPEALAIVCSPKFQENSFFTLTPEHGLNFIANCRLSGFHPHPTEPPLYRVCKNINWSNYKIAASQIKIFLFRKQSMLDWRTCLLKLLI